MEATGVYHQKFAYYLVEHQVPVSIILPNKISSYMRTLEVKTITDKSCSEAIAHFGLSRKLDQWTKPNKLFRVMQQLTRERDQILLERSAIKNKIHAEESEAEPNKSSLKRFNARIKILNKQEKEIKQEIDKWVDTDQHVKKQIENIQSVPCIGRLTAMTILAEKIGF